MYSSSDVARLLGMSAAQVRAFVRDGFLTPARSGRGLSFSFQDVVLLKTAKGLMDARIAPRRVRGVLRRLKTQLPEGRPLTAVAIAAEGNRLVVRDGREKWNPESGQALFDFDVRDLAAQVAPLVEKSARAPLGGRSADAWYALGLELEVSAPAEAEGAYRRALDLEPEHARAHVNLGRLKHEAGEHDAAEAHYRAALESRPLDTTAWFNLGVVLEDLDRAEDAVSAYQQVLVREPSNPDAHFNLARLYEKLGRPMAALRHLRTYRKLTQGR